MDRGERDTEPGPGGPAPGRVRSTWRPPVSSRRRSPRRCGRPGVREVVVDLADVRFLDSSGVRVLVHGVSVGRERDVTMRVTGPQPGVARVLRITGVGTLLGLADSDDRPTRGAGVARAGLTQAQGSEFAAAAADHSTSIRVASSWCCPPWCSVTA